LMVSKAKCHFCLRILICSLAVYCALVGALMLWWQIA
jgi:hypothetical protein